MMTQRTLGRLTISLLIGMVTASATPVAHAASDPRFFGTYCGGQSVEVVVEVRLFGLTLWTERRVIAVEVRASAEYQETFANALVHGSGTAMIDGKSIPFVFGGRVTGPGVIEGSGRVAGANPVEVTARLASDGETLWASVLGHRVSVDKGACRNQQPIAVIQSPIAREFPWGSPIDLRGVARDSEDPAFPDNRLIWQSDRQGRLGTGHRVRESFLAPGRHVITFMALDSGGRIGQDSIELTVVNNAPKPEIVRPRSGTTFYVGQNVALRGWAQDRESGNLSGEALRWSSDLQGELGTGELLTVGRLAEGTHRITLGASDGTDRASSSVRIEVLPRPAGNLPPTIFIRAPMDRTGVGSDECLVFVAEVSDDLPVDDASLFWTDSWIEDGAMQTRAGRFTGRRLELCGWATTGHDTAHTVRVTAKDRHGVTASDEVRIYVILGDLI